jgi:hypothetical protein
VEVGVAGKIYHPFLARFQPSLTMVSHVALCGVPLEVRDGTKGGAQRARSLRPRCVRVDPESANHIYLIQTGLEAAHINLVPRWMNLL